MNSGDTVSVCMATYNGERFVAHQIRSILAELAPTDELLIVDDCSTDHTVDVVTAIADPRIRVIRQQQNRGYVRTFEAAITAASRDVIFLSDQDDEWVPGRRTLLLDALRDSSIVAGDLVLLPDDAPLSSPLTGRRWQLSPLRCSGSLRNQIRLLLGDAPYYGCAMAFRREAKAWILPFPEFLVESHDLWIATVGNSARVLGHVQAPVIRRRLHDANASSPKPRGMRKALQSRWMLARAWREASSRVRAVRMSPAR